MKPLCTRGGDFIVLYKSSLFSFFHLFIYYTRETVLVCRLWWNILGRKEAQPNSFDGQRHPKEKSEGSLIVAGSPPGREKGKKYISVSLSVCVCTPRRHSYITIQLARFSRSSLSSSQTKKTKNKKPNPFSSSSSSSWNIFIRLFFSFWIFFFKKQKRKTFSLLLRII